jgi:hypothetical protein
MAELEDAEEKGYNSYPHLLKKMSAIKVEL